MYEKEFAERLAQLRTQKKISARDMSLSLGQSPGYINHIENCQMLPSMASFFNICEYLSITPQQFFDTAEKNPEQISAILDDLKYLSNEQLLHFSQLLHDIARARRYK